MLRTVTTYAELENWCRAFAGGEFDLFLLVGNPGLSKSTLLRRHVGDNALWREGTLSAFQFYCDLHRHQGDLVVIDDVDSLYSDRDAIRLLKSLCQTERVKRVSWYTASHKLAEANIPQSFETRSKVAIIANEWRSLNANAGAVVDRGFRISFEPSPDEVHRYVGAWFDDGEVYEFIGERLGLIRKPSIRYYINSRKDNRAKNGALPWRDALLESFGLGEVDIVVSKLLNDNSFATQEDRVKSFIEETGKSRPTFFRIAKKLRRA